MDNWDVSNVTDISRMFQNAESFNQPLEKWNFKEVLYFEYMFTRAISFNSELPKFKNYKGTKEELLEDLGLPSDFKSEIKKNQEQEMAHKTAMCR